MTIDTTEPAASSSAPTMSSLEQTLCSPSPPTPLDAQFRALFTIKSLASSQPESLSQGIDIIGKALSTSESALLKHELAYVLGQMQSSLALPTLTRVLEDVKEHAMVRHEAAEAMGAIGDEAALPILERFKDDEEISVRETVELAVQRIEHERKQKKAGQSIIPTSGEENPFAPIDPAPAFPVSSPKEGASAAASTSSSELLSSIPSYRTTLLDDTQTLFDRYRAMFSLRNAVHASRRVCEDQSLTPAARAEAKQKGKDAVLALCDSLNDKSALFRHEICFVFGELAHKSCVPSMLKVLSDDDEHEMVRHEAAEALGAVVEDAEEADQDDEEGPVTDRVMKELKRWAEDLEAPRVVRESCIVALDEMAYNNDNTQFQPMDGFHSSSAVEATA